MKKLILLLFVSCFLFSSALAGTTGLELSIPRYEPYPAQPGEYVDIWLKIENTGSGTANNIQIEMVDNFPFSLDPTTTANIDVGDIGIGQYELVRYKMIVAENAVQGENEISVTYSYSGFNDLTEKIPIIVQTQDAILTVKSVSSEPENFIPGKNTKLSRWVC